MEKLHILHRISLTAGIILPGTEFKQFYVWQVRERSFQAVIEYEHAGRKEVILSRETISCEHAGSMC
jgi:hypothetical protein